MITIQNIELIKAYKHDQIKVTDIKAVGISYKFIFRELVYQDAFVFSISRNPKPDGHFVGFITKSGNDLWFDAPNGIFKTPGLLVDFMEDMVCDWENL